MQEFTGRSVKQFGTQIVPVDDAGCTYLVGQYRYGVGRYSWELPAGGGRPDEEPVEIARRELREETGFVADGWLELLRLDVATSLTDARNVSFVAWGLRRGERRLDRQEVIEVRRVPFAEAVRLALGGDITDVVSIAALLALDTRLARGELPEDLAACLR